MLGIYCMAVSRSCKGKRVLPNSWHKRLRHINKRRLGTIMLRSQKRLTKQVYASVNSSCAQPFPAPRATAGHLQILCCTGSEYLPTPGPFPSFWYARGFLSEYNFWERKYICSSVKDMTKSKRVVKACSWFSACISSLLIKPELHSEIGSYR